MDWLGEIIEQLERDPEERWHAMEGLGSVEPEVRLAIIAELAQHQQRAGTSSLLNLLTSARDLGTREAARAALGVQTAQTAHHPWSEPSGLFITASQGTDDALAGPLDAERLWPDRRQPAPSECLPAELGGRLAGCLVTAVDGRGWGSIAVSAIQGGQRRTAAFLCDVTRGIRDVVGDVEPESAGAGRLIEELSEQVGGLCVPDAPDLALRLLAGCLMLNGGEVASPVRDWLLATLGPEFGPAAFPGSIPSISLPAIDSEELPARAMAVVDACPSWIDTSPLAYELAREILLREGKVAANPQRDAGAYRYLFEHRLIHRLELYGKMLLWMAWFWWCSGETELAQSAQVLAMQLGDEQFAVPAHPFTTALTTRSLQTAQAELSRASGN
jgi:hypothetical protein